MSDVENHTLALLRAMPAEMKAYRDEAHARFDAVDRRFDQMQPRLDAMHQNGLKALKGFVGHRVMVERTMASFEIDASDLKRRVSELEAART